MSLDLEQVVLPLQELAKFLNYKERESRQRLEDALKVASALGKGELAALKDRIETSRGKVRWRVAGLNDALYCSYPLPSCPPDFTVLAVDGSHIEIDYHRAAQCYLINLGQVRMDYGQQPRAILSNKAELYGKSEDMVIEDPHGDGNGAPMEGALLNALRSVKECQLLAKMAEELPGTQPVLALLDGSLILWGLGEPGYPAFVRQALLDEGLVPALDKLRSVASRRPLALASYISLPRSTDVVNALRIALCQQEAPNCRHYCFSKEATRECQAIAGLADRDLFGEIMSAGDRSPVFTSPASIVKDFYQEHQLAFFYLQAGEEIARVEFPCWIAEQPRPVGIDLLHAVTFDQCQRGFGYPVALSEAHEQAVVTNADRDSFWQLVDKALVKDNLDSRDSAKNRSKVTRWL